MNDTLETNRAAAIGNAAHAAANRGDLQTAMGTIAKSATLSRVFFYEPVSQSIRTASKYGKPTYLFDLSETRPSIWDTRKLAELIIERLESAGYKPELDYIAISGGMLPLLILCGAIVSEYGPIKALLFDATQQSYMEREIGHWNAEELDGIERRSGE